MYIYLYLSINKCMCKHIRDVYMSLCVPAHTHTHTHPHKKAHLDTHRKKSTPRHTQTHTHALCVHMSTYCICIQKYAKFLKDQQGTPGPLEAENRVMGHLGAVLLRLNESQ